MAPWAQGPSERPVRFVVPPLGLLVCGCLEGGVANTHGDHALALRGVILVAASRRFVRLMLLPIDSYCRMRKDARVLSTTPRGQQQQARSRRHAGLGEHRPGSDESTVGKSQCRSNAELRGRI
jgi:hypothetical protein